MSSPEVSKADLERIDGRTETMVREIGAKRILVDSLSHFTRLSQDSVELRAIVYGFINGLKRAGLTSILTRESPALLGDSETVDEDVAFVTLICAPAPGR
jgi:circadian clock protein KaiC